MTDTFIALDFETSGLDSTVDRIIDIGAVRVTDGKVVSKYQTYLDPGQDIRPGTSRVHLLTREFLSDKPVFLQVVDDLLAFLGSDRIVAHHARFEHEFLTAELLRAGYEPIPRERYEDTLELARILYPGKPSRLEDLRVKFGIDEAGGRYHSALYDAELLTKVYLRMIEDKPASSADIPKPFDFVTAVTSTKQDLIRSHPNPELAERAYSPYLTNRAMSYHNDTIMFAQVMNECSNLPHLLQHDFYMGIVRAKKRFSQWPKPARSEHLQAVKEYFGYGTEKAVQAILCLTDAEVERIAKLMAAKEKK